MKFPALCQTCVFCLALVCVAAAAGAVEMNLDANKATFTTDRMTVEIEDGRITNLYNRLTGTRFINGADAPKPFQPAAVYVEKAVTEAQQDANVVGPPPVLEGTEVLERAPVTAGEMTCGPAEKTGPNEVTYTFTGPDNLTLAIRYALDGESGDLLVTLDAKGDRGHLSAVQFALGPVSVHGNLILPVFHGMKAARGDGLAKFESKRWDWPTGWPIPVAMFDDPAGGFWVHTRDTEYRFKSLAYDSTEDGRWLVSFDTVNVAPFAPHTEANSVTWRINTYTGSWQKPVDQYKAWAYDAFNMDEKAWARPEWVSDLKLVIKRGDVGIDSASMDAYLDLLGQYVNPGEVLLHTRPFVKDEPVMPRWIASERGAEFNKNARNRGYRTMYFANYFSITSNHPRFPEFEKHVMRDPYTNEVQGWNLKGEWSAATDIQLYYINPASKAWQDYQVESFAKLFRKNPADALFIDQSFVMNNDNNGLIDGATCVEGNLSFHRALAKALPPETAIGGEGVNEVSFQYESVAEFHILGLEMATDANGRAIGWKLSDKFFDRMVPVMPRFLLPHTRPIGYHVGFGTSEFYPAWRDAVTIYDGIPTIARPTAEELNNPESEARRLLREIFGKG